MPSECFYVFLSGTFYTAFILTSLSLHVLLVLKPTVPTRVSEALDTVGIMHARRFGGWKLEKKTRVFILPSTCFWRSNHHEDVIRLDCGFVGQTQNSSGIINNNTTEWNNNSVTHCRTAGLSLIGGNDHIRQHKERIITLWKHEIIRWQRKSRC